MRKGILSLRALSRASVTLWALGMALMVFALAIGRSQASTGKKPAAHELKFIPGEVVVKLKKSSGFQANSLLNTLGKRYTMTVKTFKTDPSFVKVTVKDKVPMGQLLADLQANSMVEYAEPNYVYHTMGSVARLPDNVEAVVPNDPQFDKNWGLLNTGQRDPKGQQGKAGSDIDATLAWAVGTGSHEIVVAVIDTGVDYNHEDLANNIYTNAGEIPGNGIDDDGNGFIDDVRGWDFQQDDNDPMDDNRHGTHCSGSIGAEGNNGVGTAGVSWKVKILPIKFLSAGGSGSLADAVESIKYATKMGVHVMSNSWGGGGFSQAMFEAIKEARDKGILFVAAAGNEGNNNDSRPAYPATYDVENVISVAATDNRDEKASWSNFGVRTVHLGAPGVNVFSTVPMNKGGYDTFSGTSMACPHVAGAAALLWSLNRDMTFADVKARLLNTVDPVRNLRRKTITGGRLNINNAIHNTIPERTGPPADGWKSMAKQIESKHPYDHGANETFEISHPGARYMRVHFAKVGLEAGYDFVRIKNAAGETIEEVSGEHTNYMTDYVEGDRLTITFSSDSSVNGFGFAINKYEFID